MLGMLGKVEEGEKGMPRCQESQDHTSIYCDAALRLGFADKRTAVPSTWRACTCFSCRTRIGSTACSLGCRPQMALAESFSLANRSLFALLRQCEVGAE